MTAGWKTVRVFISSTFRDMHAERDYLMRAVFPELRSRCQKRGIDFIGLDLRWGVTEEESRREGPLKICLDEIERCRPFFVCLLGGRYGWVPPPEEVPQGRYEAVMRAMSGVGLKKAGAVRASDGDEGGYDAPEESRDAIIEGEHGGHPVVIADWYALDDTRVPPVYRLRHDRPVPNDVAEALARFWESYGVEHAADSITAREILRGVFEEGLPETNAFFYLRKPGITANPGFPEAFIPVFVEQDPGRRAKLNALEAKIRSCADRIVVRDYDVGFAGLRIDPSFLPTGLSDEENEGLKDGVVSMREWGSFSALLRDVILRRSTVALNGLDALGNQILEDLWAAIEKELGRPVEVLDDHERERAYHERFVIDRTELFLGRDTIVEKVLAGLTAPAGGNLTVVTGAPGSGKSALIAECTRRARERFPEALVIPHFIGASPGSSILASTLRSICETLKRGCSLPEAVPVVPEILCQKWPEFLEKAGAQRRVILFLDALNQVDPPSHSHELDWLPNRIPAGVILVVSTLPGDCFNQLRRRVPRGEVIELPVLAEPDRNALVEAHLGLRRKKLNPAQLERLLDTSKRPEVGLPLYLIVALEELSLFGSYETLTERIDRLPPTVAGLFDQVLARLEHDHMRDMTASICRWIAVSRSGMLESEILDLLIGRELSFSRARWSRFYHALEPYLRPVEEQTGEGLLDFYHDQLRLAVYRRHLGMGSQDEQATEICREVHRELAEYFDAQPPWLESIEEQRSRALTLPPTPRLANKRRAGELAWQRAGGEQWEHFEHLLTDPSFLESKVEAGLIFDLAGDFSRALAVLAESGSENRLLRLVAEAIRRDIHFIARHPTTLFQCLWNSCWWYDCPHAEKHYSAPGCGWNPSIAPWLRSGPKLFQWMETWRGAKEGAFPGFRWLRCLRPPPIHLETAIQAVLVGHKYGVDCIAFSPDGRRLVTGSLDHTVRVWDRITGRQIRCLEGHTDCVACVAFSHDGRWIASGSWDKSVRIWDWEATRERNCLRGHEDSVMRLAFLPHGRCFTWSKDESLRIWDAETGEEHRHLRRQNVLSAAVSPDVQWIAFASRDKTVRVWNTETGEERPCIYQQDGDIIGVAFSPNGSWIATKTRDIPVRIRDAANIQNERYLRSSSGFVSAAAFAPDGTRMATAGKDATVRVWDVEKGEEQRCFPHAEHVSDVTFSPDGQSIASASSEAQVWDLRADRPVRLLKSRKYPVVNLACSSDGLWIAVEGLDHTVRVWDAATGEERFQLPCQCRGMVDVKSMVFSPDGLWIATWSYKSVDVWNLTTGEKSLRLLHEDHVESVVFSRDGRMIVTESMDTDVGYYSGVEVSVWDARTGALLDISPGSIDKVAVGVKPFARTGALADDPHTTIKTADGSAIAWITQCLSSPGASADGRVWAGVAGNDLCLLALEGELPPSMRSISDG